MNVCMLYQAKYATYLPGKRGPPNKWFIFFVFTPRTLPSTSIWPLDLSTQLDCTATTAIIKTKTPSLLLVPHLMTRSSGATPGARVTPLKRSAKMRIGRVFLQCSLGNTWCIANCDPRWPLRGGRPRAALREAIRSPAYTRGHNMLLIVSHALFDDVQRLFR